MKKLTAVTVRANGRAFTQFLYLEQCTNEQGKHCGALLPGQQLNKMLDIINVQNGQTFTAS